MSVVTVDRTGMKGSLKFHCVPVVGASREMDEQLRAIGRNSS